MRQSPHVIPLTHHVRLQELLAKCHPLGMFDAIATLAVASNMRELYRLVLVSYQQQLDCLGSIMLFGKDQTLVDANLDRPVLPHAQRWTRRWRPTLPRR